MKMIHYVLLLKQINQIQSLLTMQIFPHQNDLHRQRVQLWVLIGIIQN